MTRKALLSRLPIDPYIAAIVGMVCLASVLPVHDTGAVIAGHATTGAIALLFFLHGARLAPQAALAGARHWRLHVVVLVSTFVLFPALALGARAVAPNLLTPTLWTGLVLLSVLPSTVQSSIAFTSIARGNVPAALCAATASNLLGMLLTPLLAGVLLSSHGGFSLKAVGDILVQLLLPFAAGQLARPLIGEWAQRNRTLLGLVDRGSILLVVYTAFSEAVAQGIWHQLGLEDLGRLLAVDAALLAVVLAITTYGSRLLGFSRADEVTIVFCGSKKSLSSGLPMATVLLAGQSVGVIVLPLMLFHQIQLMVCAWLAKRYANASAAIPAGQTIGAAR
ncbi:MAG: solute carrier family 10 (sodium/bile acid cotransporter), er 7 [Acetobacteraceae bacterium]|jgi:sodium/bile acid cotransporter 7|nr:solute carrier family 10 (sodium/bile acid cotransporter), er 7 [Acetobacteraceae bacterium]